MLGSGWPAGEAADARARANPPKLRGATSRGGCLPSLEIDEADVFVSAEQWAAVPSAPATSRWNSGCERRSPPPAAADLGFAVRAVRACRCTGTGWAGPHRALPIVPSIAAASVLADSKITIRKARECVRIAAGIRAWSVLRDAL